MKEIIIDYFRVKAMPHIYTNRQPRESGLIRFLSKFFRFSHLFLHNLLTRLYH